MKMNVLQKKSVLCAALLALLLSVAGMTRVMAQTPYRQYADNGVLLNFHEIDNVDFRVFLLYNLSQDDRFILVENEESGQFSVVTNDEIDVADFYDSFETFYQNTYTDFQLLSKTDIDERITDWKSEIAPQHFKSIMMDITLSRARSSSETSIDVDHSCTSDFYVFRADNSSQTDQEADIDYGCILHSYNPSWYYFRIAVSGQIIIHMEGHDPVDSSIQRDIDFCLWGPYTEEQVSSGYVSTHLTTDKIIDCSFSAAGVEDAYLGYPMSEHDSHYNSDFADENNGGTINYHVPQEGEYYILMITNFSQQPCLYDLDVECSNLPIIVDNDGPYCIGETIHLTAIGVAGAVYSWTGPNNYRSRYQNPNRSNCTMDMAGPYICTITKNGQSVSDTTWVEVYPNVNASFTATTASLGFPAQFTSTSTTNPLGYDISTYEWDFGDDYTGLGATASHHYTQAGTYQVTLSVSSGGHCTDEITQSVTINESETGFISFADANVKALCVANWDTNGDGELSYAEAAAVLNLDQVFRSNSTITFFGELQYFTGLTSIGDYAFYNCSELASVTIPNSVTTIGNSAFSSCSGLTSVTIPNSVTTIGNSAFNNCSGLTSVAIPTSVTTIGDYAFYQCSGLNSVTIPNSVTSIGDYAFYQCSGLNSVTIPNSVISIGDGVFSDCSNLGQIVVDSGNTYYDSRGNCNAIIHTSTNTLIVGCKNTVIPSSVTSIGNSAFSGCRGLTSVTIPNSVTTIGNSAFSSCSGLTSVTIPNSVTTIGNSAFSSCSGLTSVTIGNSVTSIGRSAFYYCNGLTSIVSLAETPPVLDLFGNFDNHGVFNNVNRFIPVYVPCGALYVYQSALGWSEFSNIQERGDCLIAFVDANVKALCVANWDIDGDGELNCAEAASVTSLGNVFGNNGIITSFNELIYFTGLTAVGNNTFNYCTNLTSIVIPKSVSSIEANPFSGCLSLEQIDVALGNSYYDSRGNCNAIINTSSNQLVTGCKSTIIPDSVTSIGNYAFFGCSDLTSIVIPISVVSIGSDAFYGCSGMTSVMSWAETPPSLAGNNVFYDVSTDIPVYVPCNFVENYQVANGWNSFTNIKGMCPKTITIAASPAEGGTVSYERLYDFRDQQIPSNWSNNNTYPWVVTIGHDGFFCMRSGNAGIAYSYSSIEVTVNFSDNGAFSFDYNCQGEGSYYRWDHCDFVMDGHTIFSHSADLVGWHTFSTPITAGTHTFEWGYKKDYAVNPIGDAFFVDNVRFTGVGDANQEYLQGQTCFVTAEPNSDAVFINWTENGEVVSTDPMYSFIVTGDRNLVANFNYMNHWTPVDNGQYAYSMTLYGVIQIDGVEQYSNQLELGIFCGNECRGTAMANEFFLTHRYLVEANVYGDSGDQLTFKLYDHATHQELELTSPDAITFTIDGYGNPINPYVLNFTSSMSITATTAPEGAGIVTGTGEYTIGSTCTLTATANTGFQFQNWTLNGTVVSTNPNYTFTVTGAANYVAHFQYVQSRTLVSGWNWWSTYIEQEGNNGLEMLENSLGTSGIRIQGKNNSVDYFEYQGAGYWYGSLNTIANEQMYMIRTNAACDAVIVGDAAQPANHPITINGGWNWIGYPSSQSVDVNVAMSSFTPEANDVVKGRNSVSTYISYGGYQGWYGQLNTLEPGQGYMYRSYSDATKTLTFQTGRGGETLANITPENNVFVPNTANYADNMIVTAVIDMDGEELRSEDYELAVFVGNECRGSVRLMYVEPFDRYVALLMAYGEGEEELRFVLTDGQGTSWSNDRVMFIANGTVGTMTDPAVLHFGQLGIEDNILKPIHVYPNPSKDIFNIEGEGIQKIEVVDIYGQVVLSKEVKNTNVQVDLSDKAVGAYLLRVVTDGGIVTHKLIKNN